MRGSPFSTARRVHCLAALLGAGLFGAMGAQAASPDQQAKVAQKVAQNVVQKVFGQLPDGAPVEVFTLINGRGLEVRVMTFGATLLTVKAPDRNGQSEIVTLYLDTLDEYLRGHPFFGSTVGRFANRIAGAVFTIDEVPYKLTANAGKYHIHGGGKGAFSRINWKAQVIEEADRVGVKFTTESADGDEGYPGHVAATAVYTLTADNCLVMEWLATTDKPTHINMTNHAYWNLRGAGSGDILRHVLQISADRYLPSDKFKVPTGELRRVEGGPMDFTRPQAIGARIAQVEDANYDHCYVLNKKGDGGGGGGKDLTLCARVEDIKSGRVMEVFTTQPGVQLFTAKMLNGKYQAGGKFYGPYGGFCLETQKFPDAPNKPQFPSTLLRPGEKYHEVTIHQFSVKKPEARSEK